MNEFSFEATTGRASLGVMSGCFFGAASLAIEYVWVRKPQIHQARRRDAARSPLTNCLRLNVENTRRFGGSA